jgi:hypothetical protein
MHSQDLQRLYDHIARLESDSRDPEMCRLLSLFIVAIECFEDNNPERFLAHVQGFLNAEHRRRCK